jgi:hypothetical protein
MAAVYTNFNYFGNADFREKDGRKGERERILLRNPSPVLVTLQNLVGQ